MKARLQFSSMVILALLLCFSCTRPSFTLMGIHTGVSRVSYLDSEGALTSSYESLSVFIESEEGANLQMEVTSPDGLTTWLFPASTRSVDKQGFYGKAGLSLGQWMSLPRGEWSLRALRSDGRTITEHFTLEEGAEATSFQHHLNAEEGTLVLDGQVRECAIQLLDEKKKTLYSTLTTDQTLELSKLYPQWDRVRFIGLAWYDEAARQSQIVWYTL
ncbi:MAG TPA: hypothetical protein DCG32_11245 [Sphaerochaeta sp.]|nr:hypothetical protein [Sphaerochaeta sp.]